MSEVNDSTKVWIPFALSCMLALGMIFGYTMNSKADGSLIEFIDDSNDAQSLVGQVEELIRFIEIRYVDSVDREELVSTAMNSILEKLDPHSIYISPDQMAEVQEQMDGSFKGIGIEIIYVNDTVNIINTIEGGPAAEAGITPFDKLISINDSIVSGNETPFEATRQLLRGEFGGQLKLEVLKKNGMVQEYSVEPEEISGKSVAIGTVVERDNAKAGYIKVNSFSGRTYAEFMDKLQVLTEERGIEDLIIDLRGNPGGLMPEATNILSQLFKDKGLLLVYTEGKNDKRAEYKTNGKNFFDVEKIAVLIDEHSASASEIVAGAIQDWDRGVVIGRRSFGKGLVQEQYPLSNGGALRLTVARYFTPVGRSIQRSYEDLDAYYTDFETRYYNGEFYTEDSTDLSMPSFETLIEQRKVFAGGGVTPDIFVPIDSFLFNEKYSNLTQDVNTFVYQQLYDIEKPEEINKGKLVEDIFASYLSSKDVKVSTVFQSEIKEEINVAVARYVEGEKAMYSKSFEYDPMIDAAMNYFQTDQSLRDLQKPVLAEK